MYGNPREIELNTAQELNLLRVNLIKEFQDGKKEAVWLLLNTEYVVGNKRYKDFLGFIAKALEASMRKHKYFATRNPSEDDLQDVLIRMLTSIKQLNIEGLQSNAVVGSALITMVRFNIAKHLRDTLRLENRGLTQDDEWVVMGDIDDVHETTEFVLSTPPITPDTVYEIENEEQEVLRIVQYLGTPVQSQIMMALSQGHTTREIAERLRMEESDVRFQAAIIRAKLTAFNAT